MLEEREGKTQYSNSTNFALQHAARQIWPNHDMNMMINDNNYFTQLTTLDMMRRIRASDLWIALEFFMLTAFLCTTNTHFLASWSVYTMADFTTHVSHPDQ
jgi:hypothetical protein